MSQLPNINNLSWNEKQKNKSFTVAYYLKENICFSSQNLGKFRNRKLYSNFVWRKIQLVILCLTDIPYGFGQSTSFYGFASH